MAEVKVKQKMFDSATFFSELQAKEITPVKFHRELLNLKYDFSESTCYKWYNGVNEKLDINIVWVGLELLGKKLDSFMVGYE